MTSENKQNIDDVINRFININNKNINDTDITHLIEFKKLVSEEQQNSREYELKLQELKLKKEESNKKIDRLNFLTAFLVIQQLRLSLLLWLDL